MTCDTVRMDTTPLRTTTPVAFTGTLMTAPRPLPGEPVAYVGTTAFRVYDVQEAYLDEARRLDGKVVEVVTVDQLRTDLEAWAADRGYDMADVEDAYGTNAEVAYTELNLGRVLRLEVRS